VPSRRVQIVVLMVVTAGVIGAAYASEAQDGLDEIVLALGIGLGLLIAWTARLAFGVWHGRRFDRLAALVTFSGMAVGGTWAAVDVVLRIRSDRVPFGAPRIHLMAPAVITLASAVVVVLIGGSMRGEAD
jgi:hypothetical protein